MTDNHDPDASNAGAQVTSPSKPNRGLRWRIIPGTFLALFFLMGLIGGSIGLYEVVYYNWKYGWIQIDPENRRLSDLAVTPLHVSVWLCSCCGVVVAGVAAHCWFQARWRLACFGTGVFFALMFTAKWLESF